MKDPLPSILTIDHYEGVISGLYTRLRARRGPYGKADSKQAAPFHDMRKPAQEERETDDEQR